MRVRLRGLTETRLPDIFDKINARPPSKTPELDNLPMDLQRALQRAASASVPREVKLPRSVDDDPGWLMVPRGTGVVQVAHNGLKAWRL